MILSAQPGDFSFALTAQVLARLPKNNRIERWDALTQTHSRALVTNTGEARIVTARAALDGAQIVTARAALDGVEISSADSSVDSVALEWARVSFEIGRAHV